MTTATHTTRRRAPATSGRATETPAARLKREQRAAARTHWEDALYQQMHVMHLPEPQRQYQFHPTRRYRADFAYVPERLLIEVQGGVWIAGRHTRAQGYEDDCKRTCDALEHGWRILPVTPAMIESGDAVARIERVLHTIWQQNAHHTRKAG